MSSNELFLEFKTIGDKVEELSKFLKQKEELIMEKIKDNIILKNIKEFHIKYSKIKSIDRFSIPIICKCNSGKTTFINYLLHQRNLLEISPDISTKFICIIRHTSNLDYPEIYDVDIVQRDVIYIKNENGEIIKKKVFNFKEGKKIELEGNIYEGIEKKIKEKNQNLKNNLNNQNISDYFLILKINIPLFNDPILSKYADIFEFMDIPGISDSNSNFYLKKLFPYFIYNIKFCFFIFDANDYHGDKTINLFDDAISISENKNDISTKNVEKTEYKGNPAFENTEILNVKVKIGENKFAYFKLKRFDDIFMTIQYFCEINNLDEKMIKPLIIKSLCAINTIYQVMNSKLNTENMEVLKEVKNKC